MESQNTGTGFTSHELKAIEEFVLTCCVPLVSDVDGKLALWGTGTFYRHGPTLCLVTAAHILDDVPLDQLAVPDIGSSRFTTLGSCVAHYPTQDELDLDVAVIRLHDEEFVARVTPYWRIMDQRNIVHPTPAMNRFLLAGYPLEVVREKVKPLRDKQTITREMFSQFFVTRYHGDVPGSNPLVDLFLSYGRTAQGIDGKERPTPDLGAVSGASLWVIADAVDGLWAPEKVLKIAAVQSGFKHDEYIETKTWALVHEVLRRSD